jgi:hypothetical protein
MTQILHIPKIILVASRTLNIFYICFCIKESRECSSGKLLIPSIGLLVLLQIWLLMLQKE